MNTIHICTYCTRPMVYTWEPHYQKHKERKCQACLDHDVRADGQIVIKLQDDLVQARIVFREKLFEDICKGHMWFPHAVIELGYEQSLLNYESDRVYLRYEPPVIHRLMGRGKLEDALPMVRVKILLMILRESTMNAHYSSHKGHKRA